MTINFEPSIPVALARSDEYAALTGVQRSNFDARLRYCRELSEAGLAAAGLHGRAFLAALDDMELDALVVIGSFGGDEKSVSVYQIHSSWTFEADVADMQTAGSRAVFGFMEAAPCTITTSPSELKNWLVTWASLLNDTLRDFSRASTFGEAVGQLVLMNGLISHFLTFAVMSRFNLSLR